MNRRAFLVALPFAAPALFMPSRRETTKIAWRIGSGEVVGPIVEIAQDSDLPPERRTTAINWHRVHDLLARPLKAAVSDIDASVQRAFDKG